MNADEVVFGRGEALRHMSRGVVCITEGFLPHRWNNGRIEFLNHAGTWIHMLGWMPTGDWRVYEEPKPEPEFVDVVVFPDGDKMWFKHPWELNRYNQQRLLSSAPSNIDYLCAVYEDGPNQRLLRFRDRDGLLYERWCVGHTPVYPTHIRFRVTPEEATDAT